MSLLRSLIGLFVCAVTVQAADWPQWLGPKRDGTTTEVVEVWKEKEGPKVLWREKVTSAYSAPVVADGRVFLHSRVNDKDEESVAAYDAATGKVLWKEIYARPAYRSILGAGPRATPTVAGKRLYTMGINGVVSCFDVENGKRIWGVDLYKELKAELPPFAVCGSPLVVGNRVIVSVGGKGRCVVALNTENGEIKWQALDDAASTSSAVLFSGGERAKGASPDVVFMTPLRLVGLDPLDGTLRWEHPMVYQPRGTSPTPIILGDKLIASTQAHGAVAVQVGVKDDKSTAKQAWQNKDARAYFSSGVGVEDFAFLVVNTVDAMPTTSLVCVEAKSGKELWTKAKVGQFHAGVIRTGDGKLLVLGDAGTLTLLEVNAKEAKELATAKVCGGTLINPALANGRLYVRDGSELICVQVGK